MAKQTEPLPDSYTPALALPVLTPFYDLLIKFSTRENRWRQQLVALTEPKTGERILDVGCGTGSQAIKFKRLFPEVEVVGIDPDFKSLEIAKRKADAANVSIDFRRGFLNSETVAQIGEFSYVISSLVIHQTPMKVKQEIFRNVFNVLNSSGRFYIADYGIQPNWLMKVLFRLVVQTIDGKPDTQPNADGFIPVGLEEAGFRQIEQVCEYYTMTGSISIFEAAKKTD